MNVYRSHQYPVFCFCFAALAAFMLGGCGTATVEAPVVTGDQEVSPDAAPVTIIIRSDVGEKEFEVPQIAPGTTVESIMRAVKEVPVVIEGSGMTAFVNSIDGVETGANEGWTFKVNGDFAKQGIGSTMLVPPATLTWTYSTFSEASENDDEEEVTEEEME